MERHRWAGPSAKDFDEEAVAYIWRREEPRQQRDAQSRHRRITGYDVVIHGQAGGMLASNLSPSLKSRHATGRES